MHICMCLFVLVYSFAASMKPGTSVYVLLWKQDYCEQIWVQQQLMCQVMLKHLRMLLSILSTSSFCLKYLFFSEVLSDGLDVCIWLCLCMTVFIVTPRFSLVLFLIIFLCVYICLYVIIFLGVYFGDNY